MDTTKVCKKCGRPIVLTRYGYGHVVTFARKIRADWHRATPQTAQAA